MNVPTQGSERLIGVWPAADDMTESAARLAACQGLAKLCGDHLVLPCGDPTYATFTDRCDILFAAHTLDVRLVELLAMAEKLGFKRDRAFVAGVVDVRPVSEAERRETKRRLRAVG